LPRFAVYKQQTLSEEDEEQQKKKKKNNNIDYYLRLEIEEAKTLKSWKILQSIPSEAGDQSQAIMYTQDLPSMYLYVEKNLEENAGAAAADRDSHSYEVGTISLWDTGTYKTSAPSSATITEQIRNGKVELFLAGAKLYGKFLLAKDPLSGNFFGKSGQRDVGYDSNDFWYFLKERESGEITSVDLTASKLLSQRDKATLTKRQKKDAKIAPQRQQKVLAQSFSSTITTGFPRMIKPMLAMPVDEPFNDDQWVFEFKWDGVRSILFLNRAKDKLEIQSRNGKSITHRYPEIVDQIKNSLTNGNSSVKVKESVILDGEIVVLNEKGKPDFQKHQRRMNVESTTGIRALSCKIPATYYVFDILYLDGRNLQQLPLLERRKILSDILAAKSRIRISEYVEGQGGQMFEQARSMDLEGIVAKWKHGRYLQGSRSGSWLKIKRIRTQDCVIVGYTPGEGRRESYFGSLLLAVNDQGNFRFAGHTGSGFVTATIMELYDRLQELRISKPSQGILDTVQFINREPIWVKPELVAEVKFSEWTKDEIMRIPIFLRLREDKLPQDCIVEKEKELEEIGSLTSLIMPTNTTTIVSKVEFSNLDKVFWPLTKENPTLTKKDLIDYYDSISPYILPYLKDRPLSLLRFPEGIKGQSFFHRNWEGQSRPKYVVSVMVYAEARKMKTNQLVCNNKETLLWLANLGCIEMHPMHSSVIDYEKCQESQDPNDVGCGLNTPDFVVIDLDPYVYESSEKREKGGEEPQYYIQAFKTTVEVALELKALIDEFHLRSYVKTSGKTGLHIFIPISKIRDNKLEPITYEKTRQFAKKIGNLLVARMPKKVTMEWNVKERAGKVFFDYNQNSRAKTLASVFSVRPTPLATVSMPIKWDRLIDILPTDFTLLNVPEIIRKSENPWKQMLKDRQDIYLMKLMDNN
jgi:bifunctional non-homologous end joining protein LigD